MFLPTIFSLLNNALADLAVTTIPLVITDLPSLLIRYLPILSRLYSPISSLVNTPLLLAVVNLVLVPRKFLGTGLFTGVSSTRTIHHRIFIFRSNIFLTLEFVCLVINTISLLIKVDFCSLTRTFVILLFQMEFLWYSLQSP